MVQACICLCISLEEKCVPFSLSDDIIHMQFASLLSSAHVHEHETCIGNGRMTILDDKHGNK